VWRIKESDEPVKFRRNPFFIFLGSLRKEVKSRMNDECELIKKYEEYGEVRE
jgi:hypothetical protein